MTRHLQSVTKMIVRDFIPGFLFVSVVMLVEISPDRWPVVVGTELAGVVFHYIDI